jgi:amino acid transporter
MNPRQLEARRVFEKGETLAHLSYLGLVIPMLGIVLGAMSLHTINPLCATNEDDAYKIHKAKLHAKWGIGLSIVSIIIMICCYVGVIVATHSATDKLNTATQQTMQDINQSVQDTTDFINTLN